MTICVAALAEESEAIVLIADKALTYGDNIYRPAMQGESGVIKMIEIKNARWAALLAGSPTVGEQIVTAAESTLAGDPGQGDTHAGMMDCLKTAYQTVREKTVIDQVLGARLLTKEAFIMRGKDYLPLPDVYFLNVATEVADFNANCSLLVCGFDKQGRGCIFSVRNPGVATNHTLEGFGAIGNATETALSRFLWVGAAADDDLDVALYQAFDAKRHAEMIQGVGYFSDAWIMTPSRTEKVPQDMISLLEIVFDGATRLPFKPREGWNPRRPIPRDWEAALKRFTDSALKPKRRRVRSRASVPEKREHEPEASG